MENVPSASIEERYTDKDTEEQRYVAMLLWLEILLCAQIRSVGGLNKYTLAEIPQGLIEIVKKNPGIIGTMRGLGQERDVYIYEDAAKLDSEDTERLIPKIELNRTNLIAGKVGPVFIRYELRPAGNSKARPDIATPDVKSIIYVYGYGGQEEFKTTIDGLYAALDQLAFGYEDAGFYDTITAVSKIDRRTINDRALIVKDIFGLKVTEIPDIEVILNALKKERGTNKITLSDRLAALEAAGTYRNQGFICRTKGLKTIRFNVGAYLANLREKGLLAGELEGESKRSQDQLVTEGLQRLKMNTTLNKLIHIILHEAYVQKKLDGRNIYLRKKTLMMIFGYGRNSTSKYREISDALDVMRYFEYKMYETDGNGDVREREVGYFLTRVSEQGQAYIVDINPSAVGCVVNLGKGKLEEGAFDRSYYKWAPILVYASQNFSLAGYLLAQQLISETGNPALNGAGFKVIAFKLDTLYTRLQIGYSQPSKRYKALLEAIKEVLQHGILCKIEPPLKTLLKTRPKTLSDKSIRFFMHIKIENTILDIIPRVS